MSYTNALAPAAQRRVVIRTDNQTMAMVRTGAEVAEIISTFLLGGGSAWAWDDFISLRISDPTLEAIRLECAALPAQYPPAASGHFCGDVGMDRLRSLAEKLRCAVV